MRVLILSLLVGAACGVTPGPETPSGATLQVAPEQVAPGDTVVLTLLNGASQTIGYNLCTSTLERRVGDEWEPVELGRACTMELRTMEPGGEADYRMALPTDLAAGEYRFMATVEMMEVGMTEAARSGGFSVTG